MTFRRSSKTLAAALAMFFVGSASATYQSFFAEDVNIDAGEIINPLANTKTAYDNFRAMLKAGVAVETFETANTNIGPIPSNGLSLTLNSVSSKLLNDSGEIRTGNNTGTYSVSPIPALGGRYLYVEIDPNGSLTFEIHFEQTVAAFGYFATDVGDNGGQLTVDLLTFNSNNNTYEPVVRSGFDTTPDHSIGSAGSTDGSVMFHGTVAGAGDPGFRGVRFTLTNASATEAFGFDGFTVALERDLSRNTDTPVPEPHTLALLGSAFLGLQLTNLRRQRRIRN